MRWPVEDTGRNSVGRSTTPMMRAFTSRGRSCMGRSAGHLDIGRTTDLRESQKDTLGDLPEGAALGVRRRGRDERRAGVTRLADGTYQRHLAEQRDTRLARHGG